MILHRSVQPSKTPSINRSRLSIALFASLVLLVFIIGTTPQLFGAPASQNEDSSNEAPAETGKRSQVRLRQTRPLVITLNPDNALADTEQITVTLNVINRFVLIDGVVMSAATMEIDVSPVSEAVVAAEVIEPDQKRQLQPAQNAFWAYPDQLQPVKHQAPFLSNQQRNQRPVRQFNQQFRSQHKPPSQNKWDKDSQSINESRANELRTLRSACVTPFYNQTRWFSRSV